MRGVLEKLLMQKKRGWRTRLFCGPFASFMQNRREKRPIVPDAPQKQPFLKVGMLLQGLRLFLPFYRKRPRKARKKEGRVAEKQREQGFFKLKTVHEKVCRRFKKGRKHRRPSPAKAGEGWEEKPWQARGGAPLLGGLLCGAGAGRKKSFLVLSKEVILRKQASSRVCFTGRGL